MPNASGSRGVDGSAVCAVMVIGADFAPDDLDANYHRVDGKPVHPTGNVSPARQPCSRPKVAFGRVR